MVYFHSFDGLYRIVFILFLMMLNINYLTAQVDGKDWEKDFEIYLESEGEEKDYSFEYIFEELNELSNYPLDINTISKEELYSIPFLREEQMDNLLSYIKNYGPMKSLGELWLIKGFSYNLCNLLKHFFKISIEHEEKESFTWKNVVKNSKHELITSVDIPLYKKAGYQYYSDSILAKYPNRKYLGDPLRHSIRYNLKSLDKLYFGLIAEKDAGEPFFTKGNVGYDYYSLYFMLKNIGNLKALIIGNYRLRFGLGLVMNTDFGFGKSMMLSSIGWNGRGIKRHNSVLEYNFLRGVAATYRFGKIDYTAFFSYNKEDANLDKQLLITSLKKDGLHRTPLEYSKKNNITNTVYGSNLAFHGGHFHGGLTAVYNVFNRELKTSNQYYKMYYPRGKEFFSVGADYLFSKGTFSCMGEIAYSKGGGWAAINELQLKLFEDYRFTILQRFYSHDYCSIFGNSFSENSMLLNESGVYFGFDMTPWKNWQLIGYIDFCYFPWIKYQVSNSSYSGETMLQAIYRSNNNCWQSIFRYKCKIKERDYMAKDKRKYLISHVMHRIRFQQDYLPVKSSYMFSFLLDYNYLSFMEKSGHGYMLTQRFSWKPFHLPISMDMNVSYFKTDSYDNRISIYERSFPYTYSFPSYYYHGIHGSVILKWTINEWLVSFFKVAHTNYFNRSTISSGTELIDNSHREDISFQLQFKL